MLRMEEVHVIRHKCLVEDLGIRCRRVGRGSMRWHMLELPTSGLRVGVRRWYTSGCRRGERRVLYRHYMRELSRKPQAVRQVVPELIVEMGEPYGRMWHLLEETHGAKKAARILAGVLGAIGEHGEDVVTGVLDEMLREGRSDLLMLSRHLPTCSILLESLVPAPLRGVEVEVGRAADYYAILAAGA